MLCGTASAVGAARVQPFIIVNALPGVAARSLWRERAVAGAASEEPAADRMTGASPDLRMYLFGPFTLLGPDGEELTPKSRKSRAILAMLAVAPRGSRSRVWLRDKLWSDRGEDQASASLRQALLDIRKSLGPRAAHVLTADKNTVSLDLAAVAVDALELAARERRGEEGSTEHFLEGIDVRDPEFEDWLALERQSWFARLEEAGFEADLAPRPAPSEARREASQAVPRTSPPAAPQPPQSLLRQEDEGGWRVAMMPPVILGGDPAAAVLQADVQRALRRALVETGDLRLVDMAPVALGDLGAGLAGSGLLARLPEQVHLSVQVRVLADHSYLRVGIVLQNPADNALVWSDEVIVPRRESIGEASFAMPLIVRATEEATLHFLRRHGTEGAEAEGRIAAAVASMFRLARGDLDRSEEILRRHLDRTPTAQGYAWLAFLNTFRVGQRFNPADAPLIEETQHLARRALGLEPNNALVSALVGHIHSYLFGEFDYAAALFEQSLRVNPAQTLAWDLYAMLHAYAGQPKRALAMARWARHLGAFSPHRYYFETTRAITGNFSGDHQTAIDAGQSALAERPDFNSLLRVLVSSNAHLDRPEEARLFLERLLQVEPNFSVASLRDAGYPGLDTEGGRHFLDGLVKAGVRKH
ncbi:SARP family transcriptional regulator [Cereibacter sphaeroides]|uniref:SARP family transcriptional regulator n=1 Tax=Cereibacter sphaeroides TaxID=1063 RepID=UPI0000663EA1|nr:transcriptional regulator, SARP family [Cereibacter sphaeroides ATCC 17029]